MKIYHGTATTYLPAILEQGLLPGGDGVVYLTDTQAIGFARMALHRAHQEQGHRSKPVVIEIDATKLDREALVAFQRPGSETIGTLEYHRDNVPSGCITRLAVIDPEKAPTLWREAWDAQVARGFLEKVENIEKREEPSAAYSALCAELHNLIRWLFGEAPSDFAGPPVSERAAIQIMDRAGGGRL
jgi:hypothetical protein